MFKQVMKKGISIVLLLLMLAAMLHLSVASHFCNGNLAASLVSFSGKPASCGMETDENPAPVHGIIITSHCCDNSITTLAINNFYTPTFSFVLNFFQHNFQVSGIPAILPVISSQLLTEAFRNGSPPGQTVSTNVDLSDICVYRI
jgi:hypothetical protein